MAPQRRALNVGPDHMLSGNYQGTRECHIEPDWLLIYTLLKDAVRLERTGTHSDLFD